jgi:hypothetical protein
MKTLYLLLSILLISGCTRIQYGTLTIERTLTDVRLTGLKAVQTTTTSPDGTVTVETSVELENSDSETRMVDLLAEALKAKP